MKSKSFHGVFWGRSRVSAQRQKLVSFALPKMLLASGQAEGRPAYSGGGSPRADSCSSPVPTQTPEDAADPQKTTTLDSASLALGFEGEEKNLLAKGGVALARSSAESICTCHALDHGCFHLLRETCV